MNKLWLVKGGGKLQTEERNDYSDRENHLARTTYAQYSRDRLLATKPPSTASIVRVAMRSAV
jgi:hypothetical protein